MEYLEQSSRDLRNDCCPADELRQVTGQKVDITSRHTVQGGERGEGGKGRGRREEEGGGGGEEGGREGGREGRPGFDDVYPISYMYMYTEDSGAALTH